jgi:hypothetical protein
MAISRRYQRIALSLVFFYALFYVSYHFRSRLISGFSPTDSISKGNHAAGDEDSKSKENLEEKELVVASLKGDDTGWLDDYFADWKKNVYVVNDQSAPLTVPINKGREAMPFLTYVYQLSIKVSIVAILTLKLDT